jgi:rSAM/selenodomain-associated transferase 1
VSPPRDQRILFFLRLPEEGQVKTRLGATIGQDRATELYGRFVEDILAMLDGVGIDVHICYQPRGAGLTVGNWLGQHRSYAPQEGADLGGRMANAFRDAFAGGVSRAVLIGSDIPDLPGETVAQAFRDLQRNDVVIGPSSDGGYYLIGFDAARFEPDVFESIRWSTDHVFDQTMAIVNRHRLKTGVLPVWHDVDTRSDLDALIERSRDTRFENSKTFNLIRGYGWDRPGREKIDD